MTSYFEQVLKNKRVVGITGYKGSGKTLISTYLRDKHGFSSIGVVDFMRETLATYFGEDFRMFTEPESKDECIPGLERFGTRRQILCDFGDFISANFGDFVISYEMLLRILSAPSTEIVVHGIRLPHEVNTLRKWTDFKLIRVERPMLGPPANAAHRTEILMDTFEPDVILENSQTIGDIMKKVDAFVWDWREDFYNAQ